MVVSEFYVSFSFKALVRFKLGRRLGRLGASRRWIDALAEEAFGADLISGAQTRSRFHELIADLHF